MLTDDFFLSSPILISSFNFFIARLIFDNFKWYDDETDALLFPIMHFSLPARVHISQDSNPVRQLACWEIKAESLTVTWCWSSPWKRGETEGEWREPKHFGTSLRTFVSKFRICFCISWISLSCWRSRDTSSDEYWRIPSMRFYKNTGINMWKNVYEFISWMFVYEKCSPQVMHSKTT